MPTGWPAPRQERLMPRPSDHLKVTNGDLVLERDMPAALTTAALRFSDGARQVFTVDGKTTYVDHGRSTEGEWSMVKDGAFSSFRPPDYRATYDIRWIVENGAVTGLSFTQRSGSERFDGRYEFLRLVWSSSAGSRDAIRLRRLP